jgi:peroxiredoxin
MRKLAVVLLLIIAGCKGREQAVPAERKAEPAAQATTTGSEVGMRFPEYSAMWLDGSKFELDTRRGKVVLVNVWATWCGPCRVEIPELQALHDKYGSRGFEVLGVSVDEGHIDTVKQFVEEQKMTYPVALDPEGRIANLLQTSMLPTSVLLDRDGKIVWKRAGLIPPDDAELARAIDKTL